MKIELLADFYPWIKSLHVISVIAWMAGMLYLPRLYVYHCSVRTGTAESARFKMMEYRLMRYITNPAMMAAWTFGTLLVLTPGTMEWNQGWWLVKFTCLILLSAVHGLLSIWRRGFCADANRHPARYYRIANEMPTLLMIVIVFMVIAKPF